MTDIDLRALREGDETAFRTLVTTYHPTLLRLALIYSPSRAIAEETVQETWLAVLRGLDGYAGKASFRTWVCRILVNIARRRAGLETRSLPMSELEDLETAEAVDPDRFMSAGPGTGCWRWSATPDDWSLPEDRTLFRELYGVITDAIGTLPQRQREVITLRDVDGWSAAEVAELLDLDEGHQRVLLHRARNKVRQVLEGYLQGYPLSRPNDGRRGREQLWRTESA